VCNATDVNAMNIDINKKSLELKDIVSKYDLESFVGFFAYYIKQRPPSDSGNAFDLFYSKLQDFLYLIGLNAFSGKVGTEDFFLDEKILINIANRIKEIKSAYSFNDFSFAKARTDLTYQQKAIIHELTFNNYFHNGDLTYVEQDFNIFEKTFKPLEDEIIKEFGFDLNFLLDIYKFSDRCITKKFKKSIEFTWSEDYAKLHEASLKGSSEFRYLFKNLSPDIREAFENFVDCPHYFLKFKKTDYYAEFKKDNVDMFLEIFSCKRSDNISYLYYTDSNPFETKPILKLNDDEYLYIYQKQLPNAYYKFFYQYFNKKLSKKERMQKIRAKTLENKVFEIFEDFLSNEKQTFFYRNYHIDKHDYEQDLLILTKGTALIIETKAFRFREPFRDMDKAYKKIKSDFKGNIQSGYNQCLRVKNKFDSYEKFPIYDKKGDLLFEINPRRINNVYSIIVTNDRLGPIQQDLSYLLDIPDNEEYPWSVYFNDLETFLRALKIEKNNPRNEFVSFLKNRELLHERLYSFDELDICAFFMSNKSEFIRTSNELNSTFSTMSDNQNYFDDIYFQGLGLLKNEFFLEEKKARGYLPDKRKLKAFRLDELTDFQSTYTQHFV
jgi:hypothetical protein